MPSAIFMHSALCTRPGAVSHRYVGVTCATAVALCTTLALDGVAFSQTSDLVVPPAAIAGRMQAVDEAFALYAASSGMAEMEAARLVLKSTRNADVRDYAQKL